MTFTVKSLTDLAHHMDTTASKLRQRLATEPKLKERALLAREAFAWEQAAGLVRQTRLLPPDTSRQPSASLSTDVGTPLTRGMPGHPANDMGM